MITTIIGKPGGGKSLYALRHIIKVLTETQNSVVTNLSLILPELSAYLSVKFPNLDIDVNKRIRIIDEKQSRRFWLYRLHADGSYLDLGDVTRDDEKLGINVDYSSVVTTGNRAAIDAGLPRPYPGICYILDECHVFFDSRAWAQSGLSLTFYNSQHRKLDDDVLFITQFLELIDKRVKGFSQEFVLLRNNAAEKLFTVFRGPSYFSARHYQKPPTGLHDFPSETHRFSLDLDLAKCYDTSAGVGISGVGRPETKKKKGISLLWAIVPVVLGAYLLWAAPDWLASAALGTGVGSRASESLGLTAGSGRPSVDSGVVSLGPPPVVGGSLGVDVEEAPYPTGYVMSERRVSVQMSDGTVRIEARAGKVRGVGEVTRLERNAVWLSGEKHYLKPSPRDLPSSSGQAILPERPVAPVSLPVMGGVVGSVDSWSADTGPIGRPSTKYGL